MPGVSYLVVLDMLEIGESLFEEETIKRENELFNIFKFFWIVY